MDLKTVKYNIKDNKIDPVYFFFGDEDYLIDNLIKLIKEKVVDPQTKDFNYDYLYGDEVNGNDIINLITSLPMMTDRRLVIIKSIQKLSVSDKKILAQYLDSPVDSTVLVLTANRVDRRNKFYSKAVKKSIWVECKPVYEDTAVSWIMKRFRQQEIDISKSAASIIVQLVGTSLRSLNNEINKIMTYIEEEKSVDEKVVYQVVGFYKEFNIWNLTDAVGDKDYVSAYKILNYFLEEGVSAAFLLIELTKRIILLMKIRIMLEKGMNKYSINKVMHLKNFFLNLYIQQAEKFSLSELRLCLQALQHADQSLKTGYIKPKMVLTLIIHDLTRIGSGEKFYT